MSSSASRQPSLAAVMTGLLLLLALTLAGCRDTFGDPKLDVSRISRRKLAPGIELAQIDLRRGDTDAGVGHIVYADPARAKPEIVINEAHAPIQRLAPDALAVLNAAFFTPKWRPTGLLVSQGKVLNRFVAEAGGAGSGVFVLEDGTPKLLDRDDVGDRKFDDCSLGIQAGPRVIEPDSRPGIRSDDGIRAHRTFIGADTRGRLAVGVFVGPSGWKSGLTLFELQRVLGKDGLGDSEAPELAFAFALNLDGGPSTGMHVRHQKYAVDIPEAAPVYSVLALRGAP